MNNNTKKIIKLTKQIIEQTFSSNINSTSDCKEDVEKKNIKQKNCPSIYNRINIWTEFIKYQDL